MAWTGGEIPVVTIVPGPDVGQTAQTSTQGTYQQQNKRTLLNQVFQGAGQTFAAGAGQAVGLTGANTAIQVAVTNAASKTIKGLGTGFDLTKGLNIAATSLTSSLPGIVSSSLNQSLARSLASAGPFAPLLTTIATNLTQSLVGGVVNGLLGTGQGAGENNYKSFPGAGQNESPAEYGGGGAYTLGLNGGDVVFSIRPAGSDAQSTGMALGQNPATFTTNPITDITGMTVGVGRNFKTSQVTNGLKGFSMKAPIAPITPLAN
jgi:hypothetical protein